MQHMKNIISIIIIILIIRSGEEARSKSMNLVVINIGTDDLEQGIVCDGGVIAFQGQKKGEI